MKFFCLTVLSLVLAGCPAHHASINTGSTLTRAKIGAFSSEVTIERKGGYEDCQQEKGNLPNGRAASLCAERAEREEERRNRELDWYSPYRGY